MEDWAGIWFAIWGVLLVAVIVLIATRGENK